MPLLPANCLYTILTAVCDTFRGGVRRLRPPLNPPLRMGLAPSPKMGTAPRPIFGPCLLWPNGWMDEDATWYGSRPRPRPLGIRRVPSYPRKGHSSPPLFGPCLLWPWSPISTTAELVFVVLHGYHIDFLVVCSIKCCILPFIALMLLIG